MAAEEEMVVILVVDMVVDQVVDMEAKKWEVEEGHLQEEMVVEVGGPWRESETYSQILLEFTNVSDMLCRSTSVGISVNFLAAKRSKLYNKKHN